MIIANQCINGKQPLKDRVDFLVTTKLAIEDSKSSYAYL